ncbi:TniQ family protein [Curtobacterium sp. 24E2]|nr:TniQ family protein [Curtobacterium sp. 24E2]
MPKSLQPPRSIGDAPQSPRAVRRLAKPLTPEPGEWLQTAISRWSYDIYKCSRRDLLEALGLGALHPTEIHGLGVGLRPETAETISAASDIPFVQLYAMTQSMRDRATWATFKDIVRDGHVPFEERGLDNDPLHREVIHKWCPDCLHEQPGVHAMMWRHPWMHICLKHSRSWAAENQSGSAR